MNVRFQWLTRGCLAALAWAAVAVGGHAADKTAAEAKDVITPAREELVVHEWGTFTGLQDDDGRELAGINIDDEPLPTLAAARALPPGEIGAHVSGVRFIMSTNVKTWASTGADNVTVYSNLVVGKGFYACTEMEGGVRTYVHDRKTEGGPLEQRSTVGAIVEHVTTILNDSCACRIECESKLAGT